MGLRLSSTWLQRQLHALRKERHWQFIGSISLIILYNTTKRS